MTTQSITPEMTDILKAILNGKQIQDRESGTFKDVSYGTALYACAKGDARSLRVKPPTILVNGIEVSRPEVVPLEVGEEYFVPMPANLEWRASMTWRDTDTDRNLLRRRLVHRLPSDAVQHAQAMVHDDAR
ncbi:hypothetical protein FDI24_gp030 [Acidovorax phage ACP17]|uniref:Uncharacterized protein n=1 Tax=Acidovorax phage ACP17 TaxID=2010329 RepID=A0A218M3E2_9CAUD|nr:hypothetical protein FDI24_gp030 [Acidovorax phage ACP17]ASD50564.1 hypothetical protein [Acidovorax phage ACP17]